MNNKTELIFLLTLVILALVLPGVVQGARGGERNAGTYPYPEMSYPAYLPILPGGTYPYPMYPYPPMPTETPFPTLTPEPLPTPVP